MKARETDRIKYVVEKVDGGTWTVFSLVMTGLGSKPAKNFIVQNESKQWCEGFAACLRAQEARREPEEVKRINLNEAIAETIRKMEGQ